MLSYLSGSNGRAGVYQFDTKSLAFPLGNLFARKDAIASLGGKRIANFNAARA